MFVTIIIIITTFLLLLTIVIITITIRHSQPVDGWSLVVLSVYGNWEIDTSTIASTRTRRLLFISYLLIIWHLTVNDIQISVLWLLSLVSLIVTFCMVQLSTGLLYNIIIWFAYLYHPTFNRCTAENDKCMEATVVPTQVHTHSHRERHSNSRRLLTHCSALFSIITIKLYQGIYHFSLFQYFSNKIRLWRNFVYSKLSNNINNTTRHTRYSGHKRRVRSKL